MTPCCGLLGCFTLGSDPLRFRVFSSEGLKLSQAETLPPQSPPSHLAAIANQSQYEPTTLRIVNIRALAARGWPESLLGLHSKENPPTL